jgi:hypothetical protein
MEGMIFTLILVMLLGGFILLFPLSRRLGDLLESKVSDSKSRGLPEEELRRLWDVIHGLEGEVRRLSERQQFTERMLERPRAAIPGEAPDSLPPPG